MRGSGWGEGGCSAAPGGGVAAGVEVDEGGVEADAAAEEAFVAEFDGHIVGVADGAEVNDVEGLVAGVVGTVDGAGDFAVVAGAAVGGAEADEGNAEAFADFVGDAEGEGEFFPETFGGEFVFDGVEGVAVRVDDLVGGDVAEVEGCEEVGVFVFAGEGAGRGAEFDEVVGGFGFVGMLDGRAVGLLCGQDEG